eukprot:TCONS_00031794-protein
MILSRMLLIAMLSWQLTECQISLNQANSLLCCKILSKNEISLFSFAITYQENRYHPCKTKTSAILQQMLLIISGNVELNPGPSQKLKYPCGECQKAVSSGASIACDLCNQWFHLKCTNMDDQIYQCHIQEENLEWLCPGCALADISYSLFDTSISSCSSTSTNDITPEKKKVNHLRVFVCNFQSIWNKKLLLGNYLHKNDIDVLIGSETHLSCNISNSQFLPKHYLAIRKDRIDGKGGVIFIHRDNLLVQELPQQKSELVSIKIESYEKPVILTVCYRHPSSDASYNTQLIKDISNTV